MPIDRENSPLIKAHILTTYGPVLERTLLGFILADLAEIASSMKITTKATLTPRQKALLMEEQLQGNQVKRALLTRLNSLKHYRHAIADEVISQYDLRLPTDEIVFYHDVMEEHLQHFETRVEEWIKLGAYESMHRHLTGAPVH